MTCFSRSTDLRSGGARWASVALLAGVTWLGGCAVAPGHPPPRTAAVAEPAPAAEPMFFYPERGQSDEQLDRDRYECYRWAVRQTGVDPGMQTVQRGAAPTVAPANRDGGAVVAGAATGAVVGAAVSSPRHPGPAMVLGAIFGGLMGAAAEENRAQAIEQRQLARRRDWEARQLPLQDFRRAMSACMAGRGYAVR
jgi:outer membrane lipoprotein SlyB